jgi:acyl-CoA hydrolase
MTVMTAKRSTMPKTISAAEAAGLVKSGMWVDYGGCLSQPDAFDAALGQRITELEGVKIRNCITLKPRAVLEADPEARHMTWISLHFSTYDRRMHDAGRCWYMPLNLGEVPDYYRRFNAPVDIAVIRTRPMDENGFFNLSLTNVWLRALVETARTVILEVTDALPHVHGVRHAIHASEVDYVIDGGSEPLPELPNSEPNEVDRKVGRLIASEIEDGACLQIGIGAMPNAVCSAIRDSGLRHLGVHTEMLTDGIIDLYQAGQVTGARKQIQPGKAVFTFGLGRKSLYNTVHGNEDMMSLPVDETNPPHVIMQNDNVVSINNTTSIDLTGQAASESDGHRHISGTGGQAQFVRGAYASKGGKSFICLASTYEKKGERKSRIVLGHQPGTTVTTTRADTMYVATEHGMVNLKGLSVPERARALVSIAHPDFREELSRQAREANLVPRWGFA